MVLIHSGFVRDAGSAGSCPTVHGAPEMLPVRFHPVIQWESLVDEFKSSKRTWRLEFTLPLRCLWFRRH